jgi:hypothetical protein
MCLPCSDLELDSLTNLSLFSLFHDDDDAVGSTSHVGSSFFEVIRSLSSRVLLDSTSQTRCVLSVLSLVPVNSVLFSRFCPDCSSCGSLEDRLTSVDVDSFSLFFLFFHFHSLMC